MCARLSGRPILSNLQLAKVTLRYAFLDVALHLKKRHDHVIQLAALVDLIEHGRKDAIEDQLAVILAEDVAKFSRYGYA